MTKIYQVDAFTDKPFRGNPAGVCILEKSTSDEWMQQVAAEMNLSETAFVSPGSDPFSRAFQLRWFTPTVEIKLCGHGTLATAHILWTEGYLKPTDEARFDTLSGRLTANMTRPGWITLDFPATIAEPAEPPAGLLEALGVDEALFIGRSEFDYLIEVPAVDIVKNLKPDLAALQAVQARGVMVTAVGGEKFDMVSRFFAPASGIPEDPVTGSAHCALGPYWGSKLGKTTLLAYQASPRGGTLEVKIAGDRVKLTGQAITVLRGELYSPQAAKPAAVDPRRDRKFALEEDD